MIAVTDVFMAGLKPSGLQRGRGGFLRSADDAPYVTDPSGHTVQNGARKGQIVRLKYGSPSNRGREIEGDGGLMKWKQRRALLGIGMSDDLAMACRELVGLTIDSPEFNSAADTIVAQADKVTQTMLAADRGTQGHLLSELFDKGENWVPHVAKGEVVGLDGFTQELTIRAWSRMLAANALEVLAIEAACVDDRWRLAGTLDRIVRTTRPLTFVKSGGEIVTIPANTVLVLDIKFGKCRKAHPIQIASYAQSVPYDTETEVRGEWPWPIDQTHALIAKGDFGGDGVGPTISLVWVDLTAGREHGGETVVQAKAWATRDDVFSVSQLDTEPAAKTCAVDGCDRPVLARGMCDPHYRRDRKYGDPTAGRSTFQGDGAKAFDELVLLETDDCVLWPYGKTNVGYGQLLVDGINCSTHVLACARRNGPRPTPAHEVAHSCGARACMNYRHLRWATHAENEADKAVQGTKPIGEAVGGSKLTEDQVREIRDSASDFDTSPAELARQYSVTESTIRSLLAGKTWKHVAQIVEAGQGVGTSGLAGIATSQGFDSPPAAGPASTPLLGGVGSASTPPTPPDSDVEGAGVVPGTSVEPIVTPTPSTRSPGAATPAAGEVASDDLAASPAMTDPTVNDLLPRAGMPQHALDELAVDRANEARRASYTDWPRSDPARLAIVDARDQINTDPAQGADLSAPEFELLWAKVRHEHATLPPKQADWVNNLSQEARRHNLSFHTRQVQTERSYHLAKALVTLACGGAGNDVLRALLAPILGDVAFSPYVGPGWLAGSLDVNQATRLAALADEWVTAPIPA